MPLRRSKKPEIEWLFSPSQKGDMEVMDKAEPGVRLSSWRRINGYRFCALVERYAIPVVNCDNQTCGREDSGSVDSFYTRT
jgi:hypothetical protein